MPNSRTSSRKYWRLLLPIALLSIFLGVVGFKQYAITNSLLELSFLDSLYQSIQLFTLASGSPPGIIPLTLEIARWLALIVTFSAAIVAIASLITKQSKSLFKLKFIDQHAVICGLGKQGSHIAKELIKNKQLEVVIIDSDINNPYLKQLETLGAVSLIADANLTSTLLQAKIQTARYLITTTDKDILNIDIIRQAQSLKTKETPLDCYAHVRDSDLNTLFYNQPLFANSEQHFNARLFNIYKLGARLLFAEFAPDHFNPVMGENDPAVSIVIFGFSPLAKSLILHAAHTGFYANNQKLSITLIDSHAQAHINSLLMANPDLDKIIDLNPKNQDVKAISKEDMDSILMTQQPAVTYICMKSDIKAITLARRINKLLNNTHPIAVGLLQHDTLASTLISFNYQLEKSIHLFPLIDKTSDVEQVISEKQDGAAKIIHDQYCQDQMALGDSCEKNPTLIPWHTLPEGIKDSNRGQADHLPIKLRAIGLNLQDLIETTKPLIFTKEQINTLAKMEHQRWVAGKVLDGWQATKGKKDLVNKKTPLLINFDDLPEEESHKDEQSVSVHIPRLINDLRKQQKNLDYFKH